MLNWFGTLLFCCLLIFGSSQTILGRVIIIDRILADVNGHAITLSTLEN